MISFAKIKSSSIEVGKRILKSVTMSGAATSKESYPFGFDSSPHPDLTAIYAETSNMQEAVIIGYINKNQIAEPGESRMYALSAHGEFLGFVYCRKDGTTSINGDAFSAVRFQELKTQIDLLQSQINSQLPLIASGIATGGGVYTPTNVSIDLTNVESPTVKIK